MRGRMKEGSGGGGSSGDSPEMPRPRGVKVASRARGTSPPRWGRVVVEYLRRARPHRVGGAAAASLVGTQPVSLWGRDLSRCGAPEARDCVRAIIASNSALATRGLCHA